MFVVLVRYQLLASFIASHQSNKIYNHSLLRRFLEEFGGCCTTAEDNLLQQTDDSQPLYLLSIGRHTSAENFFLYIFFWLPFFSFFSFQMVTRTKKIFVGGLSAPTTLEDVKSYFEQFGPVSRCSQFSSSPIHERREKIQLKSQLPFELALSAGMGMARWKLLCQNQSEKQFWNSA